MPRCRHLMFREEEPKDIILRKDGDVSMFDNLHESIIHSILDHLPVKDVLTMRQTNKYIGGLINCDTVARSSLRNHGRNTTFCRAVYSSHYDLLRRTVHRVDLNTTYKGLVYSVFTGRNDVAKFLMDNINFNTEGGACRCCLFRVSESFCNINCYNCCADFMKSNDPFPIRFQDLMTVACIGNNLDMVKYLYSKNLRWTQFDIKMSMRTNSIDVMEYLCKHKKARVSKKMVFELLNKFFIEDNHKMFEEMLKRKIIKVGSCYSSGIANMLCYPDCSTDIFVKLLDTYGSRRLMRNVLKAAFNSIVENVVKSILTHVNIKITKKHLDYINREEWSNNILVELMVVNKHELQQRRLMQ